MKWFKIATEGKTADGRHIEARHLEQMAKHYNKATYAARIWLEHFRSITPDGAFAALGDVEAVKAEKDESGKTALYAQLKPLPELVKINQQGQKLYTSVEIHPNFGDTGEAYLVGLAVTDSPASLGTERLMFNAKQAEPDHLFSAYVESPLQFSEERAENLLDKVKALFSKHQAQTDSQQAVRFEQLFTDLESCFQVAADQIDAFHQRLDTLQLEHNRLTEQITQLNQQVEAQAEQPARHYTARPLHTGGNPASPQLTDC